METYPQQPVDGALLDWTPEDSQWPRPACGLLWCDPRGILETLIPKRLQRFTLNGEYLDRSAILLIGPTCPALCRFVWITPAIYSERVAIHGQAADGDATVSINVIRLQGSATLAAGGQNENVR